MLALDLLGHFSSHCSSYYSGKFSTDHELRAQEPHNASAPPGFCCPIAGLPACGYVSRPIKLTLVSSNSTWGKCLFYIFTLSRERRHLLILKNKMQHCFLRRACPSFIEQEEFVQPKKQHRNRPKIPM